MMKEDVFFSNGSRPLWQTIIAAGLYIGSFCFVYSFFAYFDAEASPKNIAGPLQIAIFLFAVRLSLVIDYQFDITEKRYKKIYRFGFFEYGKWQSFKKLQYVAVYTNQKGKIELNLWYNKNKNFTLSYFEDRDASIQVARAVALKFNIDLWNALGPRMGYWGD